MAKISREEIISALPSINQIQDDFIRESVCCIWEELYNMGNWKNLKDTRFMLDCPHISLIDHVNCVTEGAIVLAQIQEKHYGTIYNYDELIASCLLHDVSKLVEMEIGENGPQKSNLGKVLQHGYYGAYYAQKFNLPLSIISNILTHTGFSKTLPSTPEAIIMFYADMADADMHHLESNIPLNIRHHK